MRRKNGRAGEVERRGYQPGIDRGYQPQSDGDDKIGTSDEPVNIQDLEPPSGDTAILPPRSETPKPTK